MSSFSRDVVLINSSHHVADNLFRLRLPVPARLKNSKVSLMAFSAYNSMYNISASQYNNATITFTWFDGTVYTWTIQDGYYSVDALSLWLQSQFIANKLYAIPSSSTTDFVYFAGFLTNATGYKNQINTYYIPSATNAAALGYTIPSGATWSWPSSNKNCQITINSGLLNYFGMKSQLSFPENRLSVAANYEFLSDTTPIVSPVYMFMLTLNILGSRYSNVPTLLAQVPINVGFGSLVQHNSVFDQRIDCREGLYNTIDLQLWNQDMQPIVMQDNEITVMLVIEEQIDSK